MEFCVVASNYTTQTQQVHVFLDNVVRRFADRGITCNVIAPQSVVRYLFKGNARRAFVSQRTTAEGNSYTVYSPLYLVFPPKKIGKLRLADWTKRSFFRSLCRVYRRHKLNADLVYAHFFHAGIPAVWLAKKLGVPSYIANGEATPWTP